VSGNLDGFVANALFITNGGTTGARMVLASGTDGNISISPGNATTGYVSINGLSINNGNATATRVFSQTTQSFTFTANAGGFGSTAGFNSVQLTKTGTSSGTAGDIAWDANYIYVCTAANVWKRTALSSF
jgi:hypothetical protein